MLMLAIVGAKEGMAEGVMERVGHLITNPTLWTVNGNSYREVKDYYLHELLQAVIKGYEHLKMKDVHNL